VDAEGALRYACRCGAVLGPADRGYRDYLPRFDAPCTVAGPYCLRPDAEAPVALRHFICPGCAALIEVDVVERT
jgi:hypothetical protein